MKFDWRYAFHSFWYLMVLVILLSTSVVAQHHALRLTAGVVLAFLIIDSFWTWQYPYFNRFGRQGPSALIDLGLFGLIAMLALLLGSGWSAHEWGLLAFSLASLGGTLDGYLAKPTKIQLTQTRAQLRKKAEILRNSLR
ncbi:hypothetical protein [Levilactobacillus yonginensis]|uniref:hypothetical protein n=1 Tax=Levilactobacillus yonginensis TaxID=1054041 RepID=UPI000F798396|nr:hypothetical protein [Levilactobacillus yonginensis]